MSAFVVENNVINGVVSFLARGRNLDRVRSMILSETGCALTTHEGRTALGKAMFELNCKAVSQRYGESIGGPEYEYRPASTPSPVQAYKSLKCWLYQCTEGDVPEASLLYSAMDKVCDSLAHHIVSTLPEYERAGW